MEGEVTDKSSKFQIPFFQMPWVLKKQIRQKIPNQS